MQVTTNLEALSGVLSDMARSQVPFATSRTINKGMVYAKEQVVQLMEKPNQPGGIKGGATRWTKQGLEYQWVGKTFPMMGHVRFKDNRSYMATLMEGGTKTNNGARLKEPPAKDHSKLNKYGNFPRQTVNDWFTKASVGRGAEWSATFGKMAKRPRKGSYHLAFGESKHKKVFGIWDWSQNSTKTKRPPKLLLFLGRNSRQQRKTFDGRRVALENFNDWTYRNYPRILGEAIQDNFKHRMTKMQKAISKRAFY